MKPLYLSVKQVMSLLGIGKSTVYKLIKDGELLGHIKLGKSINLFDETLLLEGLKKLASSKQAKRSKGYNGNRHNL